MRQCALFHGFILNLNHLLYFVYTFWCKHSNGFERTWKFFKKSLGFVVQHRQIFVIHSSSLSLSLWCLAWTKQMRHSFITRSWRQYGLVVTLLDLYSVIHDCFVQVSLPPPPFHQAEWFLFQFLVLIISTAGQTLLIANRPAASLLGFICCLKYLILIDSLTVWWFKNITRVVVNL